MSSMKITSTYKFDFPQDVKSNDYFESFQLTLASTSGHLNNQTGNIIDPKELRDLILYWLQDKFGKVYSIYELGNLEYLPHTLEIVNQRMWEWLEEILPFSVKLVGLKVVHSDKNFVEYIREEPVLVREPKTQPKLRKRRKQRGKK